MHLGNRLRAVALATAGLFVAAACGANNGTPSANLAPASQQILRANDGTEPNSFDPTQQTYTYEAAVGRNTFELMETRAWTPAYQAALAAAFGACLAVMAGGRDSPFLYFQF